MVQLGSSVLPMVAEARTRNPALHCLPAGESKRGGACFGMLVCGVENIREVMRLLEDASGEVRRRGI